MPAKKTAPPAVAPAPVPTPTPTPQPDHHFNLGQWIGAALLGLAAYQQQDAPNSGGPSIFLRPEVITPYIQGLASIFPPPTPK